MHHLWSIPEIVSFVIEYLERRDQVRMAQVCRHLYERAIPFIWRDLPDIFMLVELFPPEKQSSAEGTKSEKPGEDEFSRDKTASFSRFRFHARFVHAISITLDSYTHGDLKLLASCRPLTSSLPNLKTLIVTIGDLDNETQAELIPPTLYLPSLTTLQICPMDAGDDARYAGSFAFLTRAIPKTQLPNLESLSIEFPYEAEIGSECLAGAIRSCQGLKIVDIKTMNDTLQLEEALKTLPMLQILRLDELHLLQNTLSPPPATTTSFPSLRHLSLRATPPHIQRFLPSINSKNLEGADLTVDEGNSELAEVEEGLDLGSQIGLALKELYRFEMLKELRLCCRINFSWKDVEPVLLCGQLTKFSLVWWWYSWMTINGNHLDAMAKAWPDLLDLTVTNANTPLAGKPLIKLADLFNLTKDLSSLQNLHISFDGRRQGQEQMFDAVKNGDVNPANTSLKSLDVGCSLKDREFETCSDLGQIFSLWWPNLRELQPPQGSEKEWQGVKDVISRRKHEMELKGALY